MFVVGSLCNLTKRQCSPFYFSDSVSDSDGDFLLIEAAHQLPKWLNPETSQNRVSLTTTCIRFAAVKCTNQEAHCVGSFYTEGCTRHVVLNLDQVTLCNA